MNTQRKWQNTRTDLAIEQVSFLKKPYSAGIKQHRWEKNGVAVTEISITDERTAAQLQKPIGRYLTVEPTSFTQSPTAFAEEVLVLAENITSLLPEKSISSHSTVFVVGLGNQQITPDALGPRTIRYTMATRHLSALRKQGLPLGASVCAIAPGVLGQTGIETAEIVKSLTDTLSPSVVLVVDALAAAEHARLGKTVQLSNTGISPGSGVLNRRKELSKATLGVPVLSMGVPTVIDLPVPKQEQAEVMMVTPREIDQIIEHAAKLIGFSISKALHPELSVDDLTALIS